MGDFRPNMVTNHPFLLREDGWLEEKPIRLKLIKLDSELH